MKTMKHKYNTTLSLSVFPPSPVSNTILNTANKYTKCLWNKRNSESQKKKKINFPWPASAHPQCTGLEKKWKHATICGNVFKEHNYKFCEEFKTTKTSKAQQMYKMTDTKILGKKISENTFKKNFFKDGKRKKTKIAETKKSEIIHSIA